MGSSPSDQPSSSPEPGRVYRTVTRYWPRIAVALVFLVGAAEWIIEGLTTGGALETYVFAWAAITGSLWFLFEKAEDALSDETRERVAGWLANADLRGRLESIPAQFAVLFDRVFGERHWSRKCFYRSMLASVLAATLVYLTAGIGPIPTDNSSGGGGFIGTVVRSYEQAARQRKREREFYSAENIARLQDQCLESAAHPTEVSWREDPYPTREDCEERHDRLVAAATRPKTDPPRSPYRPGLIIQFLGAFMLLGLLLNALPDYLSLLETRWLIGRMRRGRVVALLVLDVVATSAIQLGVLWAILLATGSTLGDFPWAVIRGDDYMSPFFYSAFLTSVWLWIYGLAVLVARGLVRLGRGAGFLLRLTDVEERPFRSMGFTAVVLVSLGFLIGLPFVLVA